MTMALSGLGIAMAPAFLFADALAPGDLQELLEEWQVLGLPLHVLYLARCFVPARIRLFVEYLAQAFASDEQLRV